MHWNMDPVLVDLGILKLRWYGLFFATGVLLGARALPVYLERYKIPKEHSGPLTVWIIAGLVLFAHLIHLIFYEPRSFIDNPMRIFEIGKGLASHGGGLGTLLALAVYGRRNGLPFHRLVDPTMGAALWLIPWVRIGNFFNSEIYGRATKLPWGIVFVRRGFKTPRHPSQLYEAAICFSLLGIWSAIEKRYREKLAPGALFYLMLFGYFSTRFLIEYVKEYQALSPSFPFTMGQLLSAPIALTGLGMFLFSTRFGLRGAPELSPLPGPAGSTGSSTGRPGPTSRPAKRGRPQKRRKRGS